MSNNASSKHSIPALQEDNGLPIVQKTSISVPRNSATRSKIVLCCIATNSIISFLATESPRSARRGHHEKNMIADWVNLVDRCRKHNRCRTIHHGRAKYTTHTQKSIKNPEYYNHTKHSSTSKPPPQGQELHTIE